MTLYVTRESVCAGDDGGAPHARTFELAHAPSLEQALQVVIAAQYLPSIAGGQATWSVASGIPVAVLAQQWTTPRLLFLTSREQQDLDRKAGALRLHFNYHAQRDPELVYEVLRDLRLRAR